MKKGFGLACASAATLLCVLPARADGPFGVEMGQAPESLTMCKPHDEFFAVCDALPKMHPEFGTYAVIHTPDTGICAIIGIGKTINTGYHGFELKNATDAVKNELSTIYGRSKSYDYLSHGSIWDKPSEWVMAILKKDREYSYIWAKSEGSKMKNNVNSILVRANATHSDAGYVSLRYEFENFKSCKANMSKKNASAL